MSDEFDAILTGDTTEDDCPQCRHPNGPHLIYGETDRRVGMPTHGFRRCPEKGCECYATWAMTPGTIEHLFLLKADKVMRENLPL